jgi:hypothetical protein
MIKLKKISEIKNSNLAVILEKNKDLEILDFLKLDKKILEKIKKSLKEEKNLFLQFFLGNPKFENLYIFIYKDQKQDIEYFLGEHIKKLENNFSILALEKRILNLLDASVLARYKYQEFKKEKKEDEIFVIYDNKTKEIINDRIKTLENITLARDL